MHAFRGRAEDVGNGGGSSSSSACHRERRRFLFDGPLGSVPTSTLLCTGRASGCRGSGGPTGKRVTSLLQQLLEHLDRAGEDLYPPSVDTRVRCGLALLGRGRFEAGRRLGVLQNLKKLVELLVNLVVRGVFSIYQRNGRIRGVKWAGWISLGQKNGRAVIIGMQVYTHMGVCEKCTHTSIRACERCTQPFVTLSADLQSSFVV